MESGKKKEQDKKHELFVHVRGERDFTLCGIMDDNGDMRVGIALRNPVTEKSFIRRNGRLVASGRAQKRPSIIVTREAVEHAGKSITCLYVIAEALKKTPDMMTEVRRSLRSDIPRSLVSEPIRIGVHNESFAASRVTQQEPQEVSHE